MARGRSLDDMYANPGNVTADELIRAAEDRGWQLRRVRGSHHIFRKAGWPLVLSIPGKLQGIGTTRAIIQQLLQEERDNG